MEACLRDQEVLITQFELRMADIQVKPEKKLIFVNQLSLPGTVVYHILLSYLYLFISSKFLVINAIFHLKGPGLM